MTWNTISRPTTIFGDASSYLLQQIGDFLLLENGGKIILSGRSSSSYEDVPRPSSVYSTVSRP